MWYEKCLWVTSSLKGKFLPTPPSGRESAISWMYNVGEDQMNPRMWILPLPSASGLLGGQMSGWKSLRYCPQDGKLSLKTDESQVG